MKEEPKVEFVPVKLEDIATASNTTCSESVKLFGTAPSCPDTYKYNGVSSSCGSSKY